jgi:tetratricopeptide (TPR) repeat protein
MMGVSAASTLALFRRRHRFEEVWMRDHDPWRPRPAWLFLPLLFLALSWGDVASAAGGGGGGMPAPGGRSLTPEQKAIKAYRNGERDLEKAAGYLADLEQADGEKKRRKLRKKADDRFQAAIVDFEKAIERNDQLFQAHAQLGFALRSLGRYEEALTAYDRALEIEPRYAEAVEYRAEAYLELGRLEDCKSAYMQLYRGVPELAAQLMEKMKLFAARPAEAAGPVDSDALAAFSQWVEERDGIARQTSRLDRAAPTRW